MNVVNQYGEKWNGFAEVVAFFHVTCRYFDRFLLQGVDKNWRQACFFYLAPGLICEGYWQVNSQRSIFRIADPIYGLKSNLSHCGIPTVLVSDNWPQFESRDMKNLPMVSTHYNQSLLLSPKVIA